MPFPCTGCGLCCQGIDELKRAYPSFPYKAKADGSCEKLIDGRCSVYESRPEVCNIDRMAKKLGVELGEYHRRSAEACNALMEEAGADEALRVTLA